MIPRGADPPERWETTADGIRAVGDTTRADGFRSRPLVVAEFRGSQLPVGLLERDSRLTLARLVWAVLTATALAFATV